MKFGKHLEKLSLPKFRGYYVQYKELKKAIKVFTGQEKNQSTVEEVTHWSSSFLRLGPSPEVLPEARLQEILTRELDRISRFTELEESHVRKELAQLQSDTAAGAVGLQTLSRLDELAQEIVELKRFTELNFTGFRKILKKFDKSSKSRATPWFMGQVARAAMMNVDFDDLVHKLNNIARRVTPNVPERELPTASERARLRTQTFLVDAKQAIRIKVELAKALTWLADPHQTAAPGPAKRKVQRTTCVFFDTQELSVYQAYLEKSEARQDGPPCVSLHMRSRGTDTVALALEAPNMPSKEVWVARADVSNLLTGTAGVEPLRPSGRIHASTVKPEEGEAARSVLSTAQQALRGRVSLDRLQPRAQASFVRNVFRGAGGILAVLDEEIKVHQVAGQLPENWDAPGANTGVTGRAENLNYAVLTLSLPDQPTSEAQHCLRRVVDSAVLAEVAGYSKAAHAVGHFHAAARELAMPHWYGTEIGGDAAGVDDASEGSDDDAMKLTASLKEGSKVKVEERLRTYTDDVNAQSYASCPASRLVHEFGSTQDAVDNDVRLVSAPPSTGAKTRPAEAGGGLLTPLLDKDAKESSITASEQQEQRRGFLARLLGLLPKASAAADAQLPTRKAIVQVQPKTLYSNERTFLEWIHFATIVATMGLAMLHGTSKLAYIYTGRFLVFGAVLLTLSSLRSFNRRAKALDNKAITDYEDHLGPVLLILYLLVGLLVSTLHAAGVLQLDRSGISLSLPKAIF
eukprot:TRINITY_DN36328_c0_g1_i1.p1 TRINITY_DN36328_c0_g1~~TRINITY_DN36328_c0_g1_i1.p1  ORF type:complete len:746 (-),score=231.64 TRINITY_DN36328_c0_g1_i1:285-2522(-)